MRLLADARYSLRSFLHAPALTLALLCSIALGIGSNGAVFAFMRGLVGSTVPLDDVRGVVSIFARGESDAFTPMSFDDVQWLASQGDIFETVGGVQESALEVEIDGQRRIASVAGATPGIAAILPVRITGGAVLGGELADATPARFFDRADARIRIDRREFDVRGRAPDWLDSLYSGRRIDVWYPWPASALTEPERTSRSVWALGRLRADVTAQEAERRLAERRPAGPTPSVRAYTGLSPDAEASHARTSRLLFAAAAVVVFVACVNVMVFLLSRGSARSQEVSIRVALGASRRQLAAQLLMDSVLLAVLGAGLGAMLAVWTADLVPALFYSEDAANLVQSPDLRTVLFASLACAALMAVCALVPLIEVRDDDPAAVLRREAGGPSNTMRRLRAGLVAGQMAACSLLVISAGLLVEGFQTALRTSAGYRLGASLLATVQAVDEHDAPSPPWQGRDYFRRVDATVRESSDVTATAWLGTPPGSRPNWQTLQIEMPGLNRQLMTLRTAAFGVAAFDDIELQPAAGRMFGGQDTSGSCPSVLVNTAAASMLEHAAVGRVLEEPTGRRLEIVGVVTPKPRTPPVPDVPTVYFYAEHVPASVPPGAQTLVRTPVRPDPMPSAILDVQQVAATSLDAMGFSVIDGVALPDAPVCGVGVVNDIAAERYFGGRAVGATALDPSGRRIDIVGVVQAVQLRASQRRLEPTLYLPMSQHYQARMSVVIAAGDVSRARIDALARQLAGVGGGRLLELTTLDDHLARTALAPERIATTLVVLSAATALAIGVIGMYGAMSDATRRRRREIALRIALGARGWRIIRPVALEGLRLAAIGLAAGTVWSIAVAAWLRGIVPGAAAPPLWIWIVAPMSLVVVVVIAGILPARRALAVNPLTIMAN